MRRQLVPRFRLSRCMAAAALALAVGASADGQTGPGGAPFGGPMDDHFRRDAARGIGVPSRAFAFATEVESDVVIEQVDEQRQARGAPRFTIRVRNRAGQPMTAVDILAIVVSGEGVVRTTETLPTLKPLSAGSTRRVQAELHGAALLPTDRVGFVIKRIARSAGDVRVVDDFILTDMAAQAAQALPRRQ